MRAGLRQTRTIALAVFILFLACRAAAQPQATLTPRSKAIPLNRTLILTLELVWAGEADVYDVPQPDLSGLPEFETVDRRLSAMRRGGENLLRYEFTMKPLKVGEYDLDRMRVEYFEKGRDVPTAVHLPRTPVKVVAPEMLGPRAKTAIGASVLVAVCGVVIAMVARSRRMSREKTLSQLETDMQTRVALLAELDDARLLLIEGETGAYLEKLLELADSDPLRLHAERTDELRELAEDVKFGGHAASPDQLNWAEKMVRNAVRKAFPDKDGREEEE